MAASVSQTEIDAPDFAELLFHGNFRHAFDKKKGRTSFPVEFREILTKRNAAYLIVTRGAPERCLTFYPPAAWAGILRDLQREPQFSPEVKRFTQLYISPAQRCVIDPMGRVQIPQELREHASLDGAVMWSGKLDRVELWNAEIFKRADDEALAASSDAGFQNLLSRLGASNRT